MGDTAFLLSQDFNRAEGCLLAKRRVLYSITVAAWTIGNFGSFDAPRPPEVGGVPGDAAAPAALLVAPGEMGCCIELPG
jgi:hypothetical protein